MSKIIWEIERSILDNEIYEDLQQEGYNVELCFYDVFWEYLFSQYEKGEADFREEYEEGFDENKSDLNITNIEKYRKLLDTGTTCDYMVLVGNFIRDDNIKRVNNKFLNQYKKLENGNIELPDHEFLALHFLVLLNKKFREVFLYNTKEKYKEYTKIICKYARLLYTIDDGVRYDVLYEKMTGINLAVLVSDYLHIIRKKVEDILFDDSESVSETIDYRFNRKEIIDEGINSLKEQTKEVLEKIIPKSMIYERIFLMHKLFFDICIELDCYKEKYEEIIYLIRLGVWGDVKSEVFALLTFNIKEDEETGIIYDYLHTEIGKELNERIKSKIYAKIIREISLIDQTEREFLKDNLLLDTRRFVEDGKSIESIKQLVKPDEKSYLLFEILDEELLVEFLPYIIKLLGRY